MEAIISSINYSHWLILGVVLVIITIFIYSNILLWISFSAMIVGIININLPNTSTISSILLFIAISTISILITNKYFPLKTIDDKINKKAKKYIGKSFKVIYLDDNCAKIQIDKALWLVKGCKMYLGQTVEITAIEGFTLIVKACEKDK